MDAERGPATRTIKEWTQFTILLFATGWGVYTFVYKETVLPARRPATLGVTATLEEIGRTEETVLIRLRVRAANRTDRRVYVPALWYSVQGIQLGRQTGEITEYHAQIKNTPNAEIQARFSAIDSADLVAVGAIRTRVDDYYEPTDETTHEVLFQVPLERGYDAIEVRSQVFLTKVIEDLSLAGWDVNERGELNPQLMLSGRPYDPGFEPQHYTWALAAGAGFYGQSSTLCLWPQSGSTAPPASSPEPSAEPRITARPRENLEE